MSLSLLAGRIDRPISRLLPSWRSVPAKDVGQPPSPDYFAAILDASPYTSPEVLLRLL